MKKQELEKVIKEIIMEKTGYPEEVLESELDLEADLGIDSVKQMDIFSSLFERMGYEKRKSEDVDGNDTEEVKINTIQEMIDYCFENYENSDC